MRSYYVVLSMIAVMLAAACAEQPAPPEPAAPPAEPAPPQQREEPIPQEQEKDQAKDGSEETPPLAAVKLRALIVTNRGSINLDLFASETPITVASFVNLAQRKFYDGLTFHRVVPDFMIQGGCPRGDGTGSPGYRFPDECRPDLKHDRAGRLSMANSGPGTNGSQFFITHKATPFLNGKHTVFGSVVSDADQDVVNSIVRGDKIERIEIKGDTAPLMAQMAEPLAFFNKVLDKTLERR